MKTNFVRLSTGADLWKLLYMFLSQDEWEEKTLDLFKEDVLYKPKNINTIYLYLYIDIYIYICVFLFCCWSYL